MQFQLGPLEFLTGVSGSIGTLKSNLNVITSLTFVTNARSYGPFGKGRGASFNIPLQSNGCIVGLFGRSGRYLDAIGVYTNHEMAIIGQEEVLIYSILFLFIIYSFVNSFYILLNRYTSRLGSPGLDLGVEMERLFLISKKNHIT